jgi:hypothetical protein
MFYGVSTVGFCHYKITTIERSLTTQSNQHRGTERYNSASLLDAKRRSDTLDIL